ncbi:hypothetical protein XmelCFBP4644_18430 [Xanthomonas melonis]|uniref:Uncharacterized protein n=1 Tax=Xanthomonas melonis TaxID=56456 RepID=A0A2S7DAG1_9XANT|nr:hypothetical protein XmelCFBP4644_18430 [Xanthomonas melonis]
MISFFWILVKTTKENMAFECTFTAHDQINKAFDPSSLVKLIFPKNVKARRKIASIFLVMIGNRVRDRNR